MEYISDMFSSDNTTLESDVDIVDLTGNGSTESVVSENNFVINSSLPEYYDYYFDYAEFSNQFRVRFAKFLWDWLSLLIGIVCLFGNIIIILVLTQKSTRHFSTSIFLVSLAFSDIIVSKLFFDAFLIQHGFIQYRYNDIDCKLRLLLPVAGAHSSTITLAVISVERAVSVKMPHKVKLIFTVKFARFVVALVWIFSFTFSFYHGYVYIYTEEAGFPSCALPYNYHLAIQIEKILNAILRVASFIVIVSCTVLILNALSKNVFVKDKTKTKSVTRTLLVVNIFYIVCVTPHTSADIYYMVFVTFLRSKWSVADIFNNINVNGMFLFLKLINHVSNFFIYFLSGSKFRKQTKDLFLSCKFGK